jgi:hypothetical protein
MPVWIKGNLYASSSAIVAGNVKADTFTATSTLTASTLPYASSTALTVSGTGYFGTASTTNLSMNGESFVDLTGSGLINSANTLACATSNSSTFGCLTSANFTEFQGKISSTSLDTSAELAALLTDETGTGFAVFATDASMTNLSSASTTLTGATMMANATSTNFTTLATASSSQLVVSNGFFQGGFTGCTGSESESVLYNAATGKFTCGTDAGQGAVADWTFAQNYGVTTLTPTSTMPVWVKGNLYASSSAIVAGNVKADTFTATGTTASTLPYASSTALSVSGTGKVFITELRTGKGPK